MSLLSRNLSPAGCRGGMMLLSMWLATTVSAQIVPPRTNASPAPVTGRFLLILDTSAAMQRCAANVEQVVGNLFGSGAGGQLHRGDTIGVWTYTDDLHAGQFPLQRWTPQTSQSVARSIVDFVHSRKYEKTSQLAPVLAQLKKVVADSDRITVLLISDGTDAQLDTPYDGQIAEAYRVNAAEQRKQKMPFLTVLRAVKGRFVGYSVNTPPWPVEFPVFPVEPKTLVAEAALSAPKPQARPEPQLETKPATEIELPPVLPDTNPAPATNVAQIATVSAPEPGPPAPPLSAPTSPSNASPTVVSNPPPLTALQPAAVVQQGPPADAGGSNRLRLPIVLSGSLLVIGIVVGGGIWLVRSRSRPRASLITRSLDRGFK